LRIYLFVLLIAAAVTFLFTPAARLVARRFGAMTAVRARDVHTRPTPRLGGVAMFLGIAAAILISSRIPFLHPLFESSTRPWAILAAAGLVCLVGAADDKWDLDWTTKLAAQILAAILMVSQGVQLVTLPIGGVTLLSSRTAMVLTVLVVVVSMNAVNFVDGLDGLVAGVMAIGGTAFFVYAYLLTRSADASDYSSLAALITAAMIGACLGFLPHNWTQSRVEPSMLTGADFFGQFLPILLPIGVMIIPLLDFGMAVIRRVGAGKSPFHADRMHLHHRLLAIGHSKARAVIIMYVWTLVVCVGLLLPAFVGTRATVIFWVVGLLAAILVTVNPWGRFRGSRPSEESHAQP
jgi:UDP-GlcNAc:undecaprenyl-phosphate GlcNAc-1-phosphate transferase